MKRSDLPITLEPQTRWRCVIASLSVAGACCLPACSSQSDRNAAAGSVDAGPGGDGGVSRADSYDPCPSNGDPCKILPLGDSITYGIGLPGAYRIELFRQALAADQVITFVGSQMNGPDVVEGLPFPKNHEGYPGYTIQQIDQEIVTNALATEPDIITLMIGTNDMYGADPGGAPKRFAALVGKIFAMDSHALLIIAKLSPLSNFQSEVDTFNAALPAIAKQRAAAGKHIALVDMSETTIGNDDIHPTEAGYAHMGQVWYEAVRRFIE